MPKKLVSFYRPSSKNLTFKVSSCAPVPPPPPLFLFTRCFASAVGWCWRVPHGSTALLVAHSWWPTLGAPDVVPHSWCPTRSRVGPGGYLQACWIGADSHPDPTKYRDNLLFIYCTYVLQSSPMNINLDISRKVRFIKQSRYGHANMVSSSSCWAAARRAPVVCSPAVVVGDQCWVDPCLY